MPSWMKMNLMNSASPIMEQLIFFHDHTMIIILSITTTVMYMMMSTIKNKLPNRNILENQITETIWTIIPAILLVIIALPSLKILYLMEEMLNPSITVKAIGHQWYWSYEYSDKKKIEFESYMTKKKKKIMRNMEVDNRIILPVMTQTRMIVTSSDVIHSWTIPSLGVKMDAIPGRLNQIAMMMKKTGLFMGQCSEICGANHSFMPITLESTNMKTFIKWTTEEKT
uniref:Cytochrome c oxidase subunit 2 n=1 Tax=Metcalfa pruinosa TaxID=1185500 RepID=A0A8F2TFG3_9HEMI|nr:cytochrome c oxidase subunit II [Metcalfa pruinosa]QWV61022.1 cytochrome c oxidase subunit II [Metcalfa pruinosa]WAR47335.1 cytochrome c oxidase subunit II [Metcalfa pruinosa]